MAEQPQEFVNGFDKLNALIDAALNYSRTLLLALSFLLICGLYSFLSISRELNPDITIPFISVSTKHEGISPKDADQLIIDPLEKEFRSIEGVKEITSTSFQGKTNTLIEFESNISIDDAIIDVREQSNNAETELPDDTEQPIIKEINLALFPIILINLTGDIHPSRLYRYADDLKKELESIPGILTANIRGKREHVTEIIINPELMNSYNLSHQELLNTFDKNNRLVASGVLDNGMGRFPINVPGLFTDPQQIYDLPLRTHGDKLIRVKDVAIGHTTFKDPRNITRFNGRSTVTLEISKRIGANLISTLNEIKTVTSATTQSWPKNLHVKFANDQSQKIKDSLSDLQNNVIISTLLVMIIILCTLGIRSAILVGTAIPCSFLMAILYLNMMDYTLNMVVLFALILSVGMLVDGAIVVTEFADRRISEGASRRLAFGEASKRMAWPIIASTATTLAVFMPLIFWPGMMGEFMKYLPITLFATLTSSLFIALIAIPVLGALFCKNKAPQRQVAAKIEQLDNSEILSTKGLFGSYLRALHYAIHHPRQLTIAIASSLVVIILSYGEFGKGVEFFPKVEPENAIIYLRSRDDLSIHERDAIIELAEQKLSTAVGLLSVYSKAVIATPTNAPQDTIGVIQLEFKHWQQKIPAKIILADIRKSLSEIAGLKFEIQEQKAGPSRGKPIQVALRTSDLEKLTLATEIVTTWMKAHPHFFDVRNTSPVPGIEWQFTVNRAKAAQFGIDIDQIGTAVRLVTSGLKVGEYIPSNLDDETDIRIRFPQNSRNLDQLQNLKLSAQGHAIPFGNFVDFKPKLKEASISRSDSVREFIVGSELSSEIPINRLVDQLTDYLQSTLPEGVSFKLKGDQAQQQESQAFLSKAFISAIFLMAIILVTQFNSFYQSFLILSAVIFSTAGVLIALMLRAQPFGIVMSGVGVIALAGIVVNNNIVLIDTFNSLRKTGLSPTDAALRTGAQRLRPVILTTVTTILGLLPMVFQLTINIIQPEITVGAPSSQYWSQLSTAIAGGLAFATVLTLFLTPCLLVLGSRQQV